MRPLGASCLILLIFAVLLIIVFGLFWVLLPHSGGPNTGGGPSTVTSVYWNFSKCWTNLSVPGPGRVSSYSPFELSLELNGPTSGSCTAISLTGGSASGGLIVLHDNLPLSVNAGENGSLAVSVEFEGEATSYGPVSFNVTVSG